MVSILLRPCLAVLIHGYLRKLSSTRGLFVVRMAGNVVSPTAVGSQFSTAVLGSQLIVVLGHERCGAVSAAVKGDPLPGRIGTFVEDIKPALARIKANRAMQLRMQS